MTSRRAECAMPRSQIAISIEINGWHHPLWHLREGPGAASEGTGDLGYSMA